MATDDILKVSVKAAPFNAKDNGVAASDGIHVSDGAAGQESRAVIERCYVHDNARAGIDRNSDEGVAVFDGTMSATIYANVFHSNSSAANDAFPHIGLGVGVKAVEIAANIFAKCDAGIRDVASYGVRAASSSTKVTGDLGIHDLASTNHSLS